MNRAIKNLSSYVKDQKNSFDAFFLSMKRTHEDVINVPYVDVRSDAYSVGNNLKSLGFNFVIVGCEYQGVLKVFKILTDVINFCR